MSAVLVSAAITAGARGSSQVAGPQAENRPAYTLTGEEGMVEGVITVEGAVPPRPLVSKMESDPVCVSLNKGGAQAEDIIVERGRLADALVYVESATLDSYAFEPRPWTPALGHRRCRIAPRVLAMQAGQTLFIQNGDRTPHNPVFQTKVNPLFNKGLMPGQTFEIRYERPEPLFPVKCNQHPWERAFVAVLPHPFFAVTRRNGSFAIEGLPPGDYEVVVRHEKFREARAKVKVGPRESKVSNFTLKYPGDVR